MAQRCPVTHLTGSTQRFSHHTLESTLGQRVYPSKRVFMHARTLLPLLPPSPLPIPLLPMLPCLFFYMPSCYQCKPFCYQTM